jgi:hypothetical protein
MVAGGRGKAVLGVLILLVGVFILTGFDRKVEAFALRSFAGLDDQWSAPFDPLPIARRR